MAGIKEAMQRVMEHRNEGEVVAKGTLKLCNCGHDEKCSECNKRYLIVKLKHDGGLITVYDFGSDIHIESDIEIGDNVILMINDNWNATWERQGNSREIIS